MADDDNFDIDIYGDDPSPDYQDTNFQSEVKQEGTPMQTESHAEKAATPMEQIKTEAPEGANNKDGNAAGVANSDQTQTNGTQQIASTGGPTNDQVPLHKQAPRQQGMKRKQGDEDDRPTDPGATSALMINDLNWWISEEDIRGWANQSGCEDELIEVTFNEHKVNGKSKG
jgi:hypothetical protein